MLDTNMGLIVESRLNRRMATSGLGAIWHVSLTNPSLRAAAEHRHACMVDEKFKLIRDLARARFTKRPPTHTRPVTSRDRRAHRKS